MTVVTGRHPLVLCPVERAKAGCPKGVPVTLVQAWALGQRERKGQVAQKGLGLQ